MKSMILPVLTSPNTELRKPSENLSKERILLPETQEFFESLLHTLAAEKNGVGLAAPQVGVHDRVIVVHTKEGPTIFVNPKIISEAKQKVESEEGCFSVPGVFGIVERARDVGIRALDRKGNPLRFKSFGFEAIIFQHEIDHLDGILFIDKVIRFTK